MVDKVWKYPEILAGILLFVASFTLPAQTQYPTASATTDTAMRDKTIHYIREKFGIPDAWKLIAGPFRNSAHPDFYETNLTANDGKQTKSQNISVSKDGRYLAMSSMLVLDADPERDIARYVREFFKLPNTTQLTVGPFRSSTLPNFYETTVTADDGKKKQSQNFFITKDRRFLVLGNVFSLSANLRRDILRTISTKNQPSKGPANAPVTIVEYADLQCPTCARAQEFLEKDLLPKYGDKVRVVFKDFPLVQIHDWALTAAIASQCAYQLNPEAYLKYRSLVFQHQSNINTTDARDLLIEYGEQGGIDRLKLGACIDSKASLPRVEENMHEAQTLQFSSTPTFYINGKILVWSTPEAFYTAVDEALRAVESRRQ